MVEAWRKTATEAVDGQAGVGGAGSDRRLCMRPETVVLAAEHVTGSLVWQWRGHGRIIRCAVVYLCRRHTLGGMRAISSVLRVRSRTTCYYDDRRAAALLRRESSGSGAVRMPGYLARHWPTFTAMVNDIYHAAVDRVIGPGDPVAVSNRRLIGVLSAECRAWRRLHPMEDFPERRVTDSIGALADE